MEILLDFVYTETVLVTVENVQELLPAACLLQLKGNVGLQSPGGWYVLFLLLNARTQLDNFDLCGTITQILLV